MSDMDDTMNRQSEAFRKIWEETFSKLSMAGFQMNPASPPPEMFKQIRGSVFQSLTESWDTFMRSPEFLEGMKQSMDQAIIIRKTLNDFLNQAQHDMQAASRDDVDATLSAIRHVETRILENLEKREERVMDRLEAMADRLEALEARNNGAPAPPAKKRKPARKAGSAAKKKTSARKKKEKG